MSRIIMASLFHGRICARSVLCSPRDSAELLLQQFGRPDDCQARLPEIYRSLGAGAIDAAAAQYLQPGQMVIVVVGDREQIDEQLATLGMPVEYLSADDL